MVGELRARDGRQVSGDGYPGRHSDLPYGPYRGRSDDLMIADRKKAHGIAGVMGGEESEVSPDTSTVILESAYFDPVTVRAAMSARGHASDENKIKQQKEYDRGYEDEAE